MNLRVIALSIVIVMGLICPLAAQTAIVRSGEHGSFTRLVVRLPHVADWQVTTGQRRLTLHIRSGIDGFDTSQVFKRIGKNRIQTFGNGPRNGILNIGLACNCQSRSFVVDDTMIVIDVSDRQAGEQPKPKMSAVRKTIPSRSRKNPAVALPLIPTHGPSPPAATAITRARANLLTQLTEALTHYPVIPASIAMPSRSTPALTAPQQLGPRVNQISMAHILDHHLPMMRDETSATPPKETTCIDAEVVNIPAWHTEPFEHMRGQLWSNIYDDNGVIHPGAPLQLARFLLSYGFGAEARQVLSTFGAPDPIITELSLIIDDSPLPTPNVLSTQLNCDTAAALWGVLAYTDSSGQKLSQSDPILMNFQLLPDTLRRDLGPRLAQNLRQLGHADAADSVITRINLSIPDDPHETTATNSSSPANPQSADHDLSPFALAATVESDVEAGNKITKDTVALTDTFAFQYRRDSNAKAIIWADILAKAGAGQFLDAFDQLDEPQTGASNDQTLTIYQMLVETAPDDQFLRIIIPRMERLATFPPRLGNDIAARLLKMGFPELAQRMLQSDIATSEMHGRQILRAMAHLKERHPHRAMAALATLSGEEVEMLRKQARDMAANPAAEVLQENANQHPTAETRHNLSPAEILAHNNALLTDAGALHDQVVELLANQENILPLTQKDTELVTE